MVLLFRTVAGYHRVFHHVSGPEFSLLNLVLNLAAIDLIVLNLVPL